MTDVNAPIEVRTACHCAGTPHPDGDVFVLATELPIEAGVAAVSALANSGAVGDAGPALIGAILRNGGIVRWNLVDAEGNELAVTPANVRTRVTWLKGGVELAAAVYRQFVDGKDLTPFGLTNLTSKNGASSPNGQTERSTSPKTRSSRSRREPSKSSSPTSSDGAPSPEPQ